MNSFYELFDSVKRACQLDPKVSEIGYNRWIKCIEPGRLDGKKVTLIAPSDFTRRTTPDISGDVLARAFEQVPGFTVEVAFVV